MNSICTLLGRYINDSSHSESDYILDCPLLFNETSSSASSETLPVTSDAGALLCSVFSEQIAQTTCLVRFKNLLSSLKHTPEKQRNKKEVESNPQKYRNGKEKSLPDQFRSVEMSHIAKPHRPLQTVMCSGNTQTEFC